ncbi:uncharacterized protein LOC112516029 isoform X1 [Cynara cardunculus var. scolymus]|uniref:uncharacterized protein LOC112516029 isoform X1 n=1 Tax=Cynara cardunculus var. scolymus TaxID=59895 RepID=UPI000D626B8C|nr:uncharacterized protein LOC112516029 isoform X1 [Cynara cardunculus var. scolymus]
MGLAWLASRALRSSSSRVLSYRTIFSTPDLCKPVALGARFHFPNSDPKSCSVHIARFYYHDQLSISVNWRKQRSVASSLVALLPALFLGLSLTPVLAEDASTELTETDSSGSDFTGLRKIDDGSVVSNIHTSKWRVFTDNGRDLFLQGKLEDAERLFVGALQEAKEGFGERDPHVASACNNLAELYRVKKAFDKAEPLYLEAINILEESYGHEDVRVGAALHNLGQFYLLQKKLDAAHACYKRALKIKRQVLGEDHADYAETMYHLGKVLYLQGNVKDAEALITESIQIFEDGGQGESFLFLRRLRYLVQIYINCNKLTDAVNIQRKILHIMEVSKGRDSLETVIAAESLALTLQSVGSLMEAKELLERCLNSRKRLLPEDHIQIAANLLHMARVELLLYSQTSKDIAVIEKAKDLLGNSIRVARQALDKLVKQGANRKSNDTYSEHTALLILLQALNVLTQVEVSKAELNKEKSMVLAEKALLDCISAFKQYGSQKAVDDLKGEYLSCLKHLSGILLLRSSNSNNPTRPTLQELENEIKRVEAP